MDNKPRNRSEDILYRNTGPSLGDDVPCSKCGAVALDTGLECDNCGHDMAPELEPKACTALTSAPAEPCQTCGASEPYTGTCGTSDSDTRALCKRATQPAAGAIDAREAAPSYRVFKDGDQWCAVGPDFIDLQKSPAGFADTPGEALEQLMKEFGKEWAEKNGEWVKNARLASRQEAPAAAGAALAGEAELIAALASAEAKLIYAGADSARLDWLDATNARFRMGWDVGCAPAGNVSVKTIIMGGKKIREAIDAAMPAALKAAQPIEREDGK